MVHRSLRTSRLWPVWLLLSSGHANLGVASSLSSLTWYLKKYSNISNKKDLENGKKTYDYPRDLHVSWAFSPCRTSRLWPVWLLRSVVVVLWLRGCRCGSWQRGCRKLNV
jgi:hypothetical protein